MSDDSLVESLLDRWLAAQEDGVTLSLDDLCQTRPDLRGAVEERLADLQSFENRVAAAMRKADEDSEEPIRAGQDELSHSSNIHALRFLAKGGLGAVFVGEDRQLHRTVAVKFIHAKLRSDETARQRFELEAEVTGRLEHPGVVPLYGLGETSDRRLFYVMRYIDGITLDDAIRRYHGQAPASSSEYTLEFHRLLNHFASVCKTIAYAHYRGIVHRDIKPSNVMLGRYGETIVVDWGLAAPVAREDRFRIAGEKTLMPSSGSKVSSSSGGAGTPAYMSPEQASDLAPTPASDIYSLGATLFKLLAGVHPVIGETLAEVKTNIIDGRVKRAREINPDIPLPLEAICRKAMALRPNDRYETAIDLARDVERFLADEPVTAHDDSASTRVARVVRRHRVAAQVAVVALAACALIVGAAAIWLARSARSERLAHDEADRAYVAAEASRRGNLATSAMFLAKSVAQEIDLRWRILESEAESAELRRLVLQANESISAGQRVPASSMEEVQRWLDKRYIANNSAVRTASWFVNAIDGVQLARVPEGASIGQNFRHRDYFHGHGKDLPPADAATQSLGPLADRTVHMSAVFPSTVTETLMVAFSVPVWSAPREQADRTRVGVLCMTVELGDFSTGRSALLVDTRSDQFDGRGLVLHHPSMGHRSLDEGALRLPSSAVERALRLRRDRRQNGRALEASAESLWDGFVDPVSRERRLAAAEPVVVTGRAAEVADTGWVVIAAEAEKSAPSSPGD